MPPGDRPWAARSAGTRPGDVVAGAFLQTPVGGSPSGLQGAATVTCWWRSGNSGRKAKSLLSGRKVRLSISLASSLMGSARSLSRRGPRGEGEGFAILLSARDAELGQIAFPKVL